MMLLPSGSWVQTPVVTLNFLALSPRDRLGKGAIWILNSWRTKLVIHTWTEISIEEVVEDWNGSKRAPGATALWTMCTPFELTRIPILLACCDTTRIIHTLNKSPQWGTVRHWCNVHHARLLSDNDNFYQKPLGVMCLCKLRAWRTQGNLTWNPDEDIDSTLFVCWFMR